MSLWKFGEFEGEVDFTDADFLDALDEAKEVMVEMQKDVPTVGKSSDIIRAQCACFYAFFDTLFGDGAGERIFCGRNSINLCNEATDSLREFEEAETNLLEEKYQKYEVQQHGNRQQRRAYQKQQGKKKNNQQKHNQQIYRNGK